MRSVYKQLEYNAVILSNDPDSHIREVHDPRINKYRTSNWEILAYRRFMKNIRRKNRFLNCKKIMKSDLEKLDRRSKKIREVK